MSPISIDFLANTKDATSGVDNLTDKLGQVADSLDDVAVEAQRSSSKTTDALRDTAREGEQANDRLERSFQQLADAQASSSNRGNTIFTRNIEKASEKAAKNLDQVKEEALANASETFSSFDGSAQSIIGGIQGTFGGLVASLPGIGAAIAAAGGLAIGGLSAIVTAWTTKWQASAAQNKQAVQDMYDDMLQSGQTFLSKSLIQQNVSDIINGNNPDHKYEDAVKEAQQLRIGLGTVLLGLAGDQEAAAAIGAAAAQRMAENNEKFINGGNSVQLKQQSDQLRSYADAVDKVKTNFADAASKVQATQDAIAGLAGATDSSLTVKVKVDRSELDELHNGLRELTDGRYVVDLTATVNGKRAGSSIFGTVAQ